MNAPVQFGILRWKGAFQTTEGFLQTLFRYRAALPPETLFMAFADPFHSFFAATLIFPKRPCATLPAAGFENFRSIP